MDLDKIKESISILIDVSGTVSFSYKGDINDWISDVKLYYYSGYPESEYFIHGGPFHGGYKSKDDAINKFVECIFNENNIAILLLRIKNRYNIQDLDDCDYDELEKFIEKEKILYKQETRKDKLNKINKLWKNI